MKKIIVLLFSLLLIVGCNSNKMTCEKAKEMVNNNEAVLIDVRTKSEFDEGHLDNAINIEYQNIVEELKTREDITPSTTIILYCKSGNRASTALNSLKNAGYLTVYNLGAYESCK